MTQEALITGPAFSATPLPTISHPLGPSLTRAMYACQIPRLCLTAASVASCHRPGGLCCSGPLGLVGAALQKGPPTLLWAPEPSLRAAWPAHFQLRVRAFAQPQSGAWKRNPFRCNYRKRAFNIQLNDKVKILKYSKVSKFSNRQENSTQAATYQVAVIRPFGGVFRVFLTPLTLKSGSPKN